MSKRRTFAQWLAAFAVAPLPLLAQGVAPAERFTDGKAQPGAPELEYVWVVTSSKRIPTTMHRNSTVPAP